MSCSVCCENYNKSSRGIVECPYCPFRSCSACNEKYLCDTSEDAHCMSCRKGWTREILVENFSQKFVTQTYKTRRENLLFEREKSLMPATLPYVEIEKKMRQVTREIALARHERDVVLCREVMAITGQDPSVFAVQNNLASEFDARLEINRLSNEVRQKMAAKTVFIEYLEWKLHQYNTHLYGGLVEQEKRQFVRACPFADCRGFLSTAWKCGVCDNWTCPECHEVKGQNKDAPHTCDPGNVATAKLLAKDSRNCPKCAALIFKINGCDQMYCTQ